MTKRFTRAKVRGFSAVAILLAVAPALGGTLHVPGQYATIQAAISAAVDGDIVEIAAGTYTGDGNRDLDFAGRAITVRGVSGDANAQIIDCEGSAADPHRGFYFHNGEGPDSFVAGLTIINGYGPFETFTEDVVSVGGAVMCRYESNPTFINCIFADCYAEGGEPVGGPEPGYGGGAVYSRFCSPQFLWCRFLNNATDDDGGAFCTYAGDPVFLNCTFSGNFALDAGGAIYCRAAANPTLINVLVNDNASGFVGGGVFNRNGGTAELTSCTLVNNSAVERGGGLRTVNNAVALATNCIFWGNTAAEFPQIGLGTGATAVVAFCDIEGGWSGSSNIDAPPLFVDFDGPDNDPNTWGDNDYRLGASSPCVDSGNNDAVPADTLDLDNDDDTAEPIPLDLGGNSRFFDDAGMLDTGNGTPPIVDMGAGEFQGQTCYGDLDGDSQVGLADLAQLLGHYGMISGAVYTDGNLDRDGDVDLADLASLLGLYGRICP